MDLREYCKVEEHRRDLYPSGCEVSSESASQFSHRTLSVSQVVLDSRKWFIDGLSFGIILQMPG